MEWGGGGGRGEADAGPKWLKGKQLRGDSLGVWSLGLIDISQSVLSISISSGLLLVPLLMGVDKKCLSWDSCWKERLFGVSLAFCSQLAAISL